MSAPEITVLMPVFNAASYIEESVSSILEQSFQDFELLVIDDGSTDESVSRILAFQDPRIRLERTAVNGGIVKAMNLGLSLSRGKFIARMDADDIAEPNRLAVQRAFLEAHPEIGLCGTDFTPFGVGNTGRESWVRYTDPEDLRIALLFENPICHPTVMMRREALQGEVYPDTHPHAEEYALWIKLSRRIRLANLPDRLLRYREHSAQISRLKSAEQCASVDRLIISQLELLGLHPTKAELRLHHTLGQAFMPLPRLGGALRSWVDRLIRCNQKTRIYAEEAFKMQLEQRRINALVRTDRLLKSLPLPTRLKWRIGSWLQCLS